MKVYLVETDNGESYEDYHASIESVHKSFRSASQYLLDGGYKPFPDRDFMTGEPVVRFYWEDSEEYRCSGARIIEMELDD